MEAELAATIRAGWPAGNESPGTKSAQAFTLIEILVTIACVAVVAAVLLPAAARSRALAKRISCCGNMKRIGLSFRTWAIDHNEHFPMQVSVANGGTMELAASGAVFPHFQVLSNELSTPRVLHCGADTERRCPTNFTSDLTDGRLSYFLNMDSAHGDGPSLLSGDRNITNRATAGSPLVSLTKGTSIGWTKGLHSKQGNLCFADSSVRGCTNGAVGTFLQIHAGVTNHLAVP